MSFAVHIPYSPLTEQQITQVHRQRGYVARYFAARGNRIHNEVFEVNRREYEKHYDNNNENLHIKNEFWQIILII